MLGLNTDRQSRRTFIKRTSTSAALGLLTKWALPTALRATPAAFLREPDEQLLRTLALVAVETAVAAGVAFADVRVATGRVCGATCAFDRHDSPDPWMLEPALRLTTAYCVRAIVNGAWGVASGNELTPDAVAEVTRAAVARARANRPRRPRELELAPAPIVTNGEWVTPIEHDPFAVTIGEQADLQLSALSEAVRMAGVSAARASFSWQRTKRVFASSEGTLQVQCISLGFPSASVTVHAGDRRTYITEPVSALQGGGYGYEAVSRVHLTEEMRQAAERAAARREELTRPIPAEVGRYDLVCSPRTVAQLLTSTLGEAVNAERVLGYKTNRGGTSFAAPPKEVLGQLEVGSPLLTVHADRSQPQGATTVGWDDEGVKPEDVTIIREGVIEAYQTSRQTGSELGEWYRSRREPVRSYGCASGAGTRRPTIQLPNLTMQPAEEDITVEDLIADTECGFYIQRVHGTPDHQILNGQFAAGQVREIRNGKLRDSVQHLAFQLITPSFWQGMDAVGGEASQERTLQGTDYLAWVDGIQFRFASVSAVPARFRQVNVLNTGRTG